VARGRWGEDQAARWYLSHGYEIVDRNWRAAGGEIDLVVRRGQVVAFVEVKTRASDAYGDPALAVTVPKQLRLRRLAASWLRATAIHGVEVRFDVVSVLGVRVRVIEAAF
jgi:putative endonuclease